MNKGRALLYAAAVVPSACTGPQRMLDTGATAARDIASLWWLFTALAVITSIAIPGLLLYAIQRGRRRYRGEDGGEVDGRRLVWIGGVTIPVLMLLTVLGASYMLSGRIVAPFEDGQEALTIDVTGHQFWWEIRYPQEGVTTANEFVIPVGVPVRLRLTASDVIHSFWVPQLNGKMDLIPGRTHEWWLRADTAGSFRGQCAEYCGMSHALMAFWVRAVPQAEFDSWVVQRAERAEVPAVTAPARGRSVFVRAGCDHCHSTPGAPLPAALGAPGPDLGDVGSRTTLAAGRMPNTRANMAAWIADPQRLKPGSRMPATRLADADMDALVDYLFSLR